VDFVEICNVYIGKTIIDTAKRIFNSGKICHRYTDLNFGITFVYSARNARTASTVLAIAIPSVRLSVCLSVRPSHAGIVSKRRHVARCSLHRWIAKCV